MRGSPPPLEIGPDGRFLLNGLRPGKVILMHMRSPGSQGINLVRIERDGVAQPDGITIGQGEQVTGIRIVFAYGTGAIRGFLTMTGGNLPQGATITVHQRRAEWTLPLAMNLAATPDPRGYFTFEGLSPGTYELEARIGSSGPAPPDGRPPTLRVKQRVEVANGQTAQVTMTLDLSVKTPNSDRSSNTSASSSQQF